ncbi:hypothetical protein MUO98_01610, partial [Candidatus Bathyarchaeota archaeon]|nr:hypothetical protein [Candidatus Bathyarchaeota archaeon]
LFYYTESLNPKFLLPVSKAEVFKNAHKNIAFHIHWRIGFRCLVSLESIPTENKTTIWGAETNN